VPLPQLGPEFFIPPPINTLNSHYYQHLKGMDNFMKKIKYFDQEFIADKTPPEIPTEIPITLDLKEDLRSRNRNIYKLMRIILLR
jgi:hypothetical protein